jgi:hypothetical protein
MCLTLAKHKAAESSTLTLFWDDEHHKVFQLHIEFLWEELMFFGLPLLRFSDV